MICVPCRNTQHEQCYDKEHNTDSRSCFCQHRKVEEVKTPKETISEG